MKMARLIVHVEGQTEETFVNEVLCQHLLTRGYVSVSSRIVGNARLRQNRGGILSWLKVRKDIVNHLKQDQHCIATMMVDYYGLPAEGEGGWPGRSESEAFATPEKATHVEEALRKDVSEQMGHTFDARRFVPFVTIHEFEGLLFSDCGAFARGIERAELEPAFKVIRDKFETPEHINDSPQTAPSKRIVALLPEYEKPLLGVLAILNIGLTEIRRQCPHFDSWLGKLESLATSS